MTQKARTGQRSEFLSTKRQELIQEFIFQNLTIVSKRSNWFKNKNSEYKKALVSFKQKLNESGCI